MSLCFLSTPLPVSKSYFLDLNALLIYDVRPQLSPRLLLDRILPLSFCWRCFRVAIYNFFPYFWSWYTYFVSAPLLTFDMYIVRFQYILIYFLIPNDAPSEQSKSLTNITWAVINGTKTILTFVHSVTVHSVTIIRVTEWTF